MRKYSIYDIRQHTKANVKIGQFVLIINMAGEPQYTGRTGTVKFIDDAGQIHGTWGGCAIQPDNDIYEVIENNRRKIMLDIEVFRQMIYQHTGGLVEYSGDFQCDQTGGCPTHLCWSRTDGLAWLQPYETSGLSEEQIEKCWRDCARYGIVRCETGKEFNDILKELGGYELECQEGLNEEDEEIDVFKGK